MEADQLVNVNVIRIACRRFDHHRQPPHSWRRAAPLSIETPGSKGDEQYTGIQRDSYPVGNRRAEGTCKCDHKPKVKNGKCQQGQEDSAKSIAEQQNEQPNDSGDEMEGKLKDAYSRVMTSTSGHRRLLLRSNPVLRKAGMEPDKG
jgi:hypothetical protein